MSTKTLDKIAYITKVLKKKAQALGEFTDLETDVESSPFTDIESKSVPVEDDFAISEKDDININISDFVGDLVESGVPIEVIKSEFMDAISRFELKGDWDGDHIVAKKNVTDLLKMAKYLKAK